MADGGRRRASVGGDAAQAQAAQQAAEDAALGAGELGELGAGHCEAHHRELDVADPQRREARGGVDATRTSPGAQGAVPAARRLTIVMSAARVGTPSLARARARAMATVEADSPSS